MKASELRELTIEELTKKKRDSKEELFNLRFQHSTGQLENTSRLAAVKRDVARIETLIRQKELNIR
jgi:large subunit ribosomal protein L29